MNPYTHCECACECVFLCWWLTSGSDRRLPLSGSDVGVSVRVFVWIFMQLERCQAEPMAKIRPLWQAPAHKQEAHNEAEWHRKTAGGKLTPWVRECSQHHYTKWIKTRATGRATWNKRQRLNKQHHPRERGNEMYDPVFTLHWNCGRMVA